jgi:hypothetical protein
LASSLAAIAVLAGISGCRESAGGPATVMSATELVGRWIGSRDDLAPDGWHQSTLTFSIDGRFVWESRMNGLYGGQRRDDLSAFTRAEGTYRIDGDHLIFEPQRLVWWDRFYGAASPEHVEEPYPWSGLFDGATYSVRGDHLEMRFVVYPADAPVPQVAEYTRER